MKVFFLLWSTAKLTTGVEWAVGITGLGWVEGDPAEAINQQETPPCLTNVPICDDKLHWPFWTRQTKVIQALFKMHRAQKNSTGGLCAFSTGEVIKFIGTTLQPSGSRDSHNPWLNTFTAPNTKLG